ncbi:MAG: hypothetical protein IT389_12665 [Nitrospira sp.]|nr:hypothetical protein [Nitrospira sp.]
MRKVLRQMFRLARFFLLAIVFSPLGSADAAGPAQATLLVNDSLGSPNQTVIVEARLMSQGPAFSAGLGGEPLELLVYGKVVATAVTGEDGTARLPFMPKAQGIIPMQVRVGESSRVAPAEGLGHLAIWERRNPILTVELAALMDAPPAKNPTASARGKAEPEGTPMPDAADELDKLTQFYYRVMYVVPAASFGGDRFQASESSRQWLKLHKFPAGYVLAVPAGEQPFGAAIDALHADGWKTVKTGIGRTKSFAEAFLQRRLDAVLVPEPAKGEAPRKAKVAKEWKEIRKKL